MLPILYVEPNYQYIVTPKVSKTLDPILGEPFTRPNAKKILDILNNEGFNLSEIETAHYNDKIVAIDYGKLKNT